MAKIEREALRQSEVAFGLEQAGKLRNDLSKAIQDSATILSSRKLEAIKNMRDKHFAHSLSKTRREDKGTVDVMKYGDEREILNETIPIVEILHRCINGASFNFGDSREIAKSYANELWQGCKFDIQR